MHQSFFRLSAAIRLSYVSLIASDQSSQRRSSSGAAAGSYLTRLENFITSNSISRSLFPPHSLCDTFRAPRNLPSVLRCSLIVTSGLWASMWSVHEESGRVELLYVFGWVVFFILCIHYLVRLLQRLQGQVAVTLFCSITPAHLSPLITHTVHF